jgi:hypothetical protein
MKSSRDKSMLNPSKAKPSGVDLPKEAMDILKKLQAAKVYGSKTKYNKELQKLADSHPEMASDIFKLKVWE